MERSRTEVLIIGGSAGSLHIILDMLNDLKDDLKFPIVIVVHRKAQSESLLPKLFQLHTNKKVLELEDKMTIYSNEIYVVPSDYHALFESKNMMSLDASEKINYSRPSIDVTFRSAAEIFKKNAVAILLSGANSDGVEGLAHIAKQKGKIWIQNPQTADVDYMPKYAMEHVQYNCIFEPSNLALKINNLL